MLRVRHCVECPKCFMRYLLSFSPYGNGSYLIPTVDGQSDEYVLYCSCRRGTVAGRWRWNEVKTYEISKSAYERGYGTPDEILLINDPSPREGWSFNVSRYLNHWKSPERRKNSA